MPNNKTLVPAALGILAIALLGANTYLNGTALVNLGFLNNVPLTTSVPMSCIVGGCPTPQPLPTNANGNPVYGCDNTCPGGFTGAPTPTTTTFPATTVVSTTALAANPLRKGFLICNTGNKLVELSFVSPAGPSTVISDLAAGAASGPWDCFYSSNPVYTGAIFFVFQSSGTGNLVVTSIK
jgi:hypothetical protein